MSYIIVVMKKYTIIFVLFYAVGLFAHPHVWIDADVSFSCDKSGKCSADSVWTFDVMFSRLILNDFDIDGDKVFIGVEHKKLKAGMFDNLRHFNYFQNIMCEDDLVYPDGISGFKGSVKGSKVIYKFRTYYDISDCPDGYEFFMYDSTNYTDITLKKIKGSGHKTFDDGFGKIFVKFSRKNK